MEYGVWWRVVIRMERVARVKSECRESGHHQTLLNALYTYIHAHTHKHWYIHTYVHKYTHELDLILEKLDFFSKFRLELAD